MRNGLYSIHIHMLDGVDGGVGQNRIATDQLHTRDTAVFADAGEQLDRALNAHLPRQWRIYGLNGFDQQPLRYSLRYLQFLWGLLR